MNIDELRSAQSKERQKSDLQQLRESFYGDVAAYVEELEDERERAAERAEDPFGSPEVQQLTNDIETAKDTAEAIYERRLGKIVKKASLVSAEMANPNDVSGLTTEEQALFDDLVDRIEANKAHMLDVIAGDADPGARDASGSDSTTDSTTRSGSTEATATDATAADATAADEATSVPHPEDGLGAGPGADGDASDGATSDADSGETADPRAAEAAAVAGDDPPGDDAAGSSGGSEPDASVAAADLMGGDADAAGIDDGGQEHADDGANDDGAYDDRASDDGAYDDRASGEDADAPATGTDGGVDERTTLRVTQDVGEIFGVDEREYKLSAEDVVTLPEENATVLVEQGAAERLD